jgi:hypothetical protein
MRRAAHPALALGVALPHWEEGLGRVLDELLAA